MTHHKKSTSKKSHALLSTAFLTTVGIIILVIVLATASYLIYLQNYENKIFPGVTVASIDVGGMTPREALETISKITDVIENRGMVYRWQNYDVYITPTLSDSEGGVSYEIMTFDTNATIDKAYSVGRVHEKFWQNSIEQIQTLLFQTDVFLNYHLDRQELVKTLKENFTEFEKPAQNAKLYFEEGEAKVEKEVPGEVFDYSELAQTTDEHLAALNIDMIELSYVVDEPKITATNSVDALTDAQDLRTKAPLVLTYEGDKWEIDTSLLEASFAFDYDHYQGVIITLSTDTLADYLGKVAEEINVEPKEGKFEVQDGNIVQIQESQIGKSVDVKKNLEKITSEVVTAHNMSVELVMEEKQPKINAENIQDLGIKEKIGEGRSNFAGSSYKRIHNIEHGASKLHGLLIAPDEEFSLVSTLKPFTLEDGWVEELVIKGNKTIPEVGGGGCQLGTTMFRAAMGAGLPITERQNHSYVVSYYYENGVPGTDATIYDPKPDMRFINDTGNYILIQTHIEGTQLIYEFWGTSDGRVADRTIPVVYDRVGPPPRKEIQTTDLAPGEVKCTEKPHAGLKTTFDYTITFADGTQKKETFNSTYKPWQEVCLVGVAAQDVSN